MVLWRLLSLFLGMPIFMGYVLRRACLLCLNTLTVPRILLKTKWAPIIHHHITISPSFGSFYLAKPPKLRLYSFGSFYLAKPPKLRLYYGISTNPSQDPEPKQEITTLLDAGTRAVGWKMVYACTVGGEKTWNVWPPSATAGMLNRFCIEVGHQTGSHHPLGDM